MLGSVVGCVATLAGVESSCRPTPLCSSLLGEWSVFVFVCTSIYVCTLRNEYLYCNVCVVGMCHSSYSTLWWCTYPHSHNVLPRCVVGVYSVGGTDTKYVHTSSTMRM